MTPAERIRDTIDAMSERHVPRIIIDEQAEQILKDLAEGDFVVVHCPKGKRVVLDRTGDADRLTTLPSMEPDDSVRATLKTDGSFDVRRLVAFTKYRHRHERSLIEVMQPSEAWMDGTTLFADEREDNR